MKKAVLVIDMPKNCSRCKIRFLRYLNSCDMSNKCPVSEFKEYISTYLITNTKPDWCPLKEMPEKKEIAECYTQIDYAYKDGWNNCINEILD